jgi:hypothetical protein
VFLNDGKGVERLLIFIGRRKRGTLSGRMMIGHVEMHDGAVPMPGLFMIVIVGIGGVQVKERRGEKPQ